MAKKICLDAGHYGKYNRSPAVKEYYESVRMWALHLLLCTYLKEYGFEVVKTRADQTKDMNVYDRGYAAKGCDLFLSLHSNAVGSGVNENIDHPIAYAAINGKADGIAAKLTQCVEKVMGTREHAQITHKKGSRGDYYGVLRGATAVGVPGLILEHSFHTNSRSTNWLMKDDNLDKLAKAEAEVIADYFGMKKPEPAAEYKPGMYKVNVEDLNIRTGPGTGYTVCGAIKDKGTYTITEIQNKSWGKLKSGAGWVNCNAKYCTRVGEAEKNPPKPESGGKPFDVRVKIKDLHIRKGPGTGYGTNGYCPIGTYCIVETREADGYTWGRLKSGAGWIALKYIERV